MERIPDHNHDGVNSPRIPQLLDNLMLFPVQATITALAGGGQSGATQIKRNIVEIAVCATAGDSVKLPFAKQGLWVFITNHGANSCNVFPNSLDKINEAAADSAKALAADASMIGYAYDNVNWEFLTLAR